MSNKMEQWSRRQTLLLIEKYREKELLYKITHPDYFKIPKKNAALEEIAEELKEVKPNLNIREIKSKIKVLNQQIAQEKKRIRANVRSGIAADAYVPRLWCYKELSFLLDAKDEVRGHSSIECDKTINTTYLDNDTTEATSRKRRMHTSGKDYLDSDTTEATSRKRRMHTSAKDYFALRQSSNKSIELVQKLLETKEDKEEIFCRMLCSELKQLKREDTYDSVTADLFAIVRKAKIEEREEMRLEPFETQPAAYGHQRRMSSLSSNSNTSQFSPNGMKAEASSTVQYTVYSPIEIERAE